MVLTGHVHGKSIELDDKKIKLPDGKIVKIIYAENEVKADRISGAWEDERSAKEIIEDIQSSRINKRSEINL